MSAPCRCSPISASPSPSTSACYVGGTIVLHERWDTERVLADIARYKATYFRRHADHVRLHRQRLSTPVRHDLSSLRLCTTGGAPVPQSVVQRFEEMTGARVIQVYGSTETLRPDA